MSGAREWFEEAFGTPEEGPFPITFRFGGADRRTVMSRWNVEIGQREEERIVTMTDPVSGLQCRCEARLYEDFPAVEWVAFLTNTSRIDSPIIENVHALDWVFAVDQNAACELHHAKGSDAKIDDFEPLTTPLPRGADAAIGSHGGRSSNGSLPFFNLVTGDSGIIGAVGWSGDWSARFGRGGDGEMRITAGTQKTHLRLRPGEEIRTPRMLLLWWEGDIIDAHNMLRRFILAHHTPKPDGELLRAPMCCESWGAQLAEKQPEKARRHVDAEVPFDCFWIDAGWYGEAPVVEDATVFNTPWHSQVGNWFPNPAMYPEGLKPVGDALREMGLGFLLWIEPERVYEGTKLALEHPEWLLSHEADGKRNPSYLFNLGDPDARAYLTDLVSSIISEAGLAIYRQDFNINPAPYWHAADSADRVGMTEIRYIEGFYAMWDELLLRHPVLVIDNCASGGRRIDLETISRSIPLWRSDYQCYPDFIPTGMQAQTHGLAKWVPLSTGVARQVDPYDFRSALGPGIVLATKIRNDEPFPGEMLRKLMGEEAEVRQYFYGDFYPIVSFSLSDDTWAAWQFDRPDLGEGMVLALRRPNSPFTSIDATLRGLDPGADYEITSKDTGDTIRLPGSELAGEGLPIEIDEKPGSALFVYRKEHADAEPPEPPQT